MQADFSQHSVIDERFHVLVNSRERYGRDLLPDMLVQLFRAGMTVQLSKRIPDDLPLMGERQTSGRTQIPKMVPELRTHNNFYCWIKTIQRQCGERTFSPDASCFFMCVPNNCV